MADSWEDLENESVAPLASVATAAAQQRDDNAEEDSWEPAAAPQAREKTHAASVSSGVMPSTSQKSSTASGDDRPLLLVDLTVLSEGALHNKFDKSSCNDPDLKREWTRKIEDAFSEYESNTEMLSSGVLRPCGASVWREALSQLRDEYPGHFWAPVFPPPELAKT
mmetsp:Transcript_10885/g.30830  ORF Transcript_10885/g.30830 Transcript_10885/m.30830 type:complete len:166 (+) Transcript_10885:89-586(+)